MSPRRFATTSTDGAHRARQQMVERQLRRRGIDDARVLDAMGAVPRERFVPSAQSRRAYRDGALAIGDGQTISQPWIVAQMITLLELDGHERVLEVGTGSGYAAAVLSRCCAEVISIERHGALAQRAQETLAGLGYANVEVRHGDGTGGAGDRAPFGGILVAASAEHEPPAALRGQLDRGAALICPVRSADGEHLMRYREGDSEAVTPVRFVPLVEGA